MDVGSSRMSKAGSRDNTPARAVNCFEPDGSEPGCADARFAMEQASRQAETRDLARERSSPTFSGPNATSSSTVSAMS
jgi:hypothetical protein